MAVNLTRLAKCFEAVGENLHFGRAAQQLGMSQPALSQAIKQLEGILGCQLLVRSGAGVSLSRDGEIVLMRARTLLRAEQEFVSVRRNAVPMLGIAHEVPEQQALALIRRMQPVTAVRAASATCVADVRSGTLTAAVVTNPALLTGVKPLGHVTAGVTLWSERDGNAITTAHTLREGIGPELAVSPRRWNTAQAQETKDGLRRAGVVALRTEVENQVDGYNVIARGGAVLNLGSDLPGCNARPVDPGLIRLGFQLIVHPAVREDAGWDEAFSTAFRNDGPA